MKAQNILETIGNTPHVRLQRLFGDRVEVAVQPMIGAIQPWNEPRTPILLAGKPSPGEDSEFGELPWAAYELSHLRELWGEEQSNYVGGERLTLANVLGTDLGSFRTIHFATHAVASTRDPRRCGVILSGDERLSFEQISRLKLNSNLVVVGGYLRDVQRLDSTCFKMSMLSNKHVVCLLAIGHTNSYGPIPNRASLSRISQTQFVIACGKIMDLDQTVVDIDQIKPVGHVSPTPYFQQRNMLARRFHNTRWSRQFDRRSSFGVDGLIISLILRRDLPGLVGATDRRRLD